MQKIACPRTRWHNFTLSYWGQDRFGGPTKQPERASCLFAWRGHAQRIIGQDKQYPNLLELKPVIR